MTIVVVEDDEDVRPALAEVLRDDGHRVQEFANPAQVPLHRLGDVDLVVTDYRMPEQDGLQFADAFHALYPRVPVIMITGDPSLAIDAAVSRRPHMRLGRKPLGCADVRAMITDATGASTR
jgi:DNA-binding NtrC family response regulator